GYRYCRESRHPLLRKDKARFFERRVRSYRPLMEACMEFAPSKQARASIQNLASDLSDLFGKPNEDERRFSSVVVRKAAEAFALRGEGDPPMIKEEFRRYRYFS